MKGFATDIWWTVATWIIVIVIVMITLLALIAMRFMNKDVVSYSINFISIMNTPYNIAEVITSVPADDRVLLEHFLESMAVGSLEKAESDGIEGVIEDFMSKYEFKYNLVLNDSTKRIMMVGRIPDLCGPNLEGICVIKRAPLNGCGIGMEEIEFGNNPCPSFPFRTRVCCKAVENPVEGELYNGYELYRCGSGNEGFCNPTLTGRVFEPYFSYFCGEGMIHIDDAGMCKNKNIDKSGTPNCCKPMTKDDMIAAGLFGYAEMPLLYKDKFGKLEVITQ